MDLKNGKALSSMKAGLNLLVILSSKKMFHILPKRVMTEAPFLSDGLRH